MVRDAARSLDAMRPKRAFLVTVRFNALRGVARYCAIAHCVMLRDAVRSLDAMCPKRAFCMVSGYRTARGIPLFWVTAQCDILSGIARSASEWYCVLTRDCTLRDVVWYLAITQCVVFRDAWLSRSAT